MNDKDVLTLWQKLIRNCVKTPSGCWRWQGAIDKDGYAIVRVGKKVRRGHDVTWEIHNGRPIPPGHQPDHTCRLTSCVRPHQLEIVTCGENKRRAWLYQKRASHCPQGHAMTPAKTYRRPGQKFRECRKCRELSIGERSKFRGHNTYLRMCVSSDNLLSWS